MNYLKKQSCLRLFNKRKKAISYISQASPTAQGRTILQLCACSAWAALTTRSGLNP